MDRFFKGFSAGVAGAIVMTIWDLIAFHFLDFSEHRYLDWSSVMLMGDRPNTLAEIIYSQFIHLIWSGFLGITFAFLIIIIGNKGLIIKGAIFGFISGFIFYAIPKLFKVIHLYDTPIESVMANHLGSVIWGLVTAYILRLLNNRYKEES